MTRSSSAVQASREDSQFLDGSSFVDAMEEAQAKGDLEIVELNLPTLDQLLVDVADRKKELDTLLRRARTIRQRHEASPADRRDSDRGTYVSQTKG
jgi:hypothetical protein